MKKIKNKKLFKLQKLMWLLILPLLICLLLCTVAFADSKVSDLDVTAEENNSIVANGEGQDQPDYNAQTKASDKDEDLSKAPEEDLNPKCSLHYDERCIAVYIESSKAQVSTYQVCTSKTLAAAFKKAATNYKDNKDMWKILNENHYIELCIDGYTYIGTDAVTQKVINDLATTCWPMYKPLDGEEKLKVFSIEIGSPDNIWTEFQENCIHDLSYCKKIKIEHPDKLYKSKNSINNLKDLIYVELENFITRYEEQEINDMISNVKENCILVNTNPFRKDQGFEYIDNSWKKVDDEVSVFTNVGYKNHTLGISCQGSTQQIFTSFTLRQALISWWCQWRYLSIFWDQSLTLSIGSCKEIRQNSITKDIIDDTLRAILLNNPYYQKLSTSVKSISLYHPNAREVSFYESDCINNLPDLKSITIYKANFHHNCINNCPSLENVYVENTNETYSKETLKDSINQPKDGCVFILRRDFGKNQHFKYIDGVWTESDKNIDLDPSVEITKENNLYQIKIVSSAPAQSINPQVFSSWTLEEAFKKVDYNKPDENFWKELNNAQTIKLYIDSYPTISSDSISQDVINEIVSHWPQYKPNDEAVKLKINNIYFERASIKEVTFDGSNCVHDLPYCNRIDIASVNWADNCICNMRDLTEIFVYNYSETFEHDTLNSAVSSVKDGCFCYLKPKYVAYNKIFEYTQANNWSEGTTLAIDVEPKVSIEGSTIVIESSKAQFGGECQHFSSLTLKKAFKEIVESNNVDFWNRIKDNPYISLKINKYSYICSESISTDSILRAIKWVETADANDEVYGIKIQNIYLPCAADFEVKFMGPNCIYDLPDCKLMDIERADFADNCIHDLPQLEDIIVHNREEGFDADIINKSISKVKNSCLCEVRRHLRVTDKFYEFDANKNTWNEISDRNDLQPTVSVNGSAITITSSLVQSTFEQACSKHTLRRVFQKVAETCGQNFWENINNTHTINLVVDSYTHIPTDAISQDIINDLCKYWDKYVPLSDNVKLKIETINFKNSASTCVNFDGKNCVYNLPDCRLIDIERATFADNCIHDLPQLQDIIIHNREDGFDVAKINKSILKVKNSCLCEVRRSLRIADKFYEFDGIKSSWNELSDRNDLQPTISVNGAAITITSSQVQSTHEQACSKYTLRRAFQKVAETCNQNFWENINKTHTINLVVDRYTHIPKDAISQDIINDLCKYWDKYTPLNDKVKLQIGSIKFEDSATTSVIFDDDNCIHDLPFCSNIEIRRITWPKEKTIINNLPDLKQITIHNKSDGVEISELNTYIKNVANGCLFDLFRGIFWHDLHYIYNAGSGWSERK